MKLLKVNYRAEHGLQVISGFYVCNVWLTVDSSIFAYHISSRWFCEYNFFMYLQPKPDSYELNTWLLRTWYLWQLCILFPAYAASRTWLLSIL
jgi:hypothetical protein